MDHGGAGFTRQRGSCALTRDSNLALTNFADNAVIDDYLRETSYVDHTKSIAYFANSAGYTEVLNHMDMRNIQLGEIVMIRKKHKLVITIRFPKAIFHV